MKKNTIVILAIVLGGLFFAVVFGMAVVDWLNYWEVRQQEW
jgi:hypothetical protein